MSRPDDDEHLYGGAADLYDLAFDWGFEDEVDWLVDRWGDGVRTVLELACGSGRYFPLLLDRGVVPVGIDLSESMLERAQRRLEEQGYPPVRLLAADMAGFEIDLEADAAFCSVNSLAYLPSAEAVVSHLRCVADALRSGAPYLIQLGTYSPDDEAEDFGSQTWETDVGDGTVLDFTWELVELDIEAARAINRSTIEVTSGPREGEVVVEDHPQLAFTWESWTDVIDVSPFELAAVYDGDAEGRPPVTDPVVLREGNPLFWHELRLP